MAVGVPNGNAPDTPGPSLSASTAVNPHNSPLQPGEKCKKQSFKTPVPHARTALLFAKTPLHASNRLIGRGHDDVGWSPSMETPAPKAGRVASVLSPVATMAALRSRLFDQIENANPADSPPPDESFFGGKTAAAETPDSVCTMVAGGADDDCRSDSPVQAPSAKANDGDDVNKTPCRGSARFRDARASAMGTPRIQTRGGNVSTAGSLGSRKRAFSGPGGDTPRLRTRIAAPGSPRGPSDTQRTAGSIDFSQLSYHMLLDVDPDALAGLVGSQDLRGDSASPATLLSVDAFFDSVDQMLANGPSQGSCVSVDQAADGRVSSMGAARGVSDSNRERALAEAALCQDVRPQSSGIVGDKLPEHPPRMGGFAAASGKKLKVPSAESLAKAQALCLDGDRHVPLEESPSGFATAGGKALPRPSEKSLNDARALLEDSGRDEPLGMDLPSRAGFTTAGGKALCGPSAASLAKARAQFRGDAAGFATAGGKAIVGPSAESLEKARALCLGDDLPLENPVNPQETIGFTTAGGKALLDPSTESLARARALCQDDYSAPSKNTTEPAGFTTARGKAIDGPSTESLARARALCLDDNPPCETPREPAGFTTARGGTLRGPAAESLAKARAICSDNGEDAPCFPKGSTGSFALNDAAMDSGPAGLSGAQSEKYQAETLAGRPAVNNLPSGFKAASGKKLDQPKVESMARAIKLCDNGNVVEVAATVGFQPLAALDAGAQTPAARVRRSPERNGTPTSVRQTRHVAVPAVTQTPVSHTTTAATPRLVVRNSSGRKSSAFKPVNPKRPPPTPATPVNKPRATGGKHCPTSVFDWTTSGARETLAAHFGAVLSRANASAVPVEIQRVRFATAGRARVPFSKGARADKALDADSAVAEMIAAGAVEALVSAEWVQHHVQLIVWKLASEVRRDPALLPVLWTAETVLGQLLYRYECEQVAARRSCLQLVAEGDDSPARATVLCVAELRPRAGEVLLTDGWYSLWAKVGAEGSLARALQRGALRVGDKLIVLGCELTPAGEPVAALEASESQLRLCLNSNRVRRTRWDAPLGWLRPLGAFPAVRIASLERGGGAAAHLRVCVLRVYPLQYVENRHDGGKIVRDERGELEAQRSFERQIERELSCQPREATCRLTVLVGDCTTDAVPRLRPARALMTIWRPDESTMALFSEGRAVSLYNVGVSSFSPRHARRLLGDPRLELEPGKSSDPDRLLGLQATRATRYLSVAPIAATHVPRVLITPGALEQSAGTELDLVGALVGVGDVFPAAGPSANSQSEQFIYLADASGAVAAVRLLGATAPSLLYGPSTVGSLWAVRSAIYELYDARAGFHVLRTVDVSDWKPAHRYAGSRDHVAVLDEWVRSSDAVWRSVVQRISRLVG